MTISKTHRRNVRARLLMMIGILVSLVFGSSAGLSQNQKTTDHAPAVEPKPIVRSVTPASLQVYADAQKRKEEARELVEASPAWMNYVIAQNQQQSALLYVMAENGIKPSDGCKAMTKDGKVLTEGLILDHFECPAKTEKKEAK